MFFMCFSKELGCHAHHTSPILRRYDHPQKFCSSQVFCGCGGPLNNELCQGERMLRGGAFGREMEGD